MVSITGEISGECFDFDRLSSCRLGGVVLKREQKQAVASLLDGKDVMAVLPTGFGKSMIYQCFVLAKEMVESSAGCSSGRPSCLVIVPLRSIIDEQIRSNELDLAVKGFAYSEDVLEDIKNNKYQVIYASAEQALSTQFLQVLRDESSALLKSISLIVVDESHTVETWGKGSKRGKRVSEPFRKDFGALSTLRSFCSGVPILAITGTATKQMQSNIVQQLAMGNNAITINVSPNRDNIRFTVFPTTTTDQFEYLGWLVKLVKEKNMHTPKSIIFCSTMHDVAQVFGFLLAELGAGAYSTGKPQTPENRLVGIYHSLTLPKYKSRVSQSFKENVGQIRVVIATSALSMGVNFPDVRYVVHIGPARSVVDHIQEAGRAGRDGNQAHNVVLFHGNQLSYCDKAVKEFVRASICIRTALFKEFAEVDSTMPLHNCCSNCAKECICADGECSQELFAFEDPKPKSVEPVIGFQRPVSEEDKETLREALYEIKSTLDMKSPFIFDSKSGHGFTNSLVNDLVASAARIFSLSDILKKFPVFNIGHGKLILEIFYEIFEDIEDFEEMMATVEPDDLLDIAFHEDTDDSSSSGTDSDPDRKN
ncbi:hypothetical protein ACROYT_G003230 [Oculina patagonica]